MNKMRAKLSDRTVMAMRRLARRYKRFPVKKYARKFNVSVTTVSKAVTGKRHKHLNDISPPFSQGMYDAEMKTEALRLRAQGLPYSAIAKEIGISKQCAWAWTKEISTPLP